MEIHYDIRTAIVFCSKRRLDVPVSRELKDSRQHERDTPSHQILRRESHNSTVTLTFATPLDVDQTTLRVLTSNASVSCMQWRSDWEARDVYTDQIPVLGNNGGKILVDICHFI
ncbi:hypothetical protein AVEN_196458-1 [Araneus ventricosus]|uniref:Uncharacterized protein n=1 Tax=Araneus ventricosus TaxID=182803 RepID=A0A4Y2AUC7_ARAVE|nr:hypothetical protein AVEN_196458-1 [Araneus ventricosus]